MPVLGGRGLRAPELFDSSGLLPGLPWTGSPASIARLGPDDEREPGVFGCFTLARLGSCGGHRFLGDRGQSPGGWPSPGPGTSPKRRGSLSRLLQENAPLLQVERLGVTFSTPRGVVRAVREASLEVRRGELVGLAGETGCGKSTTAFAIVGYLPGTAQVDGSIRFEGRDITDLSVSELRHLRGNRIAMVDQDPATSLNPTMRVGFQIEEVRGSISAWTHARPVNGRRSSSRASVWPSRTSSADAIPTSSAGGCSNGWSSPWPWHATRICSLWTSPPQAWTSPPKQPSWTWWWTSKSESTPASST